MKRSRFTETKIVSILDEADAGASVQDISCRLGDYDGTFYNWNSLRRPECCRSEASRLCRK